MKVLVGLLMLPLVVQAADGGKLSDEYGICIDKGQTNHDWSECGGAELKRQDDLLNVAWARVKKTFSGTDFKESLKALRAEQVAWIKWRDTTCAYYWMDFGREGAVLSYPSCRASIIAQRTDYLNRLAAGMEERAAR